MGWRARLLVLRADWLLRAANRRRRRQLATELGRYVGHAELNDLHAVLDMYPDGQTQEIRQILQRQQANRIWTTRRAGGGGFAH